MGYNKEYKSVQKKLGNLVLDDQKTDNKTGNKSFTENRKVADSPWFLTSEAAAKQKPRSDSSKRCGIYDPATKS